MAIAKARAKARAKASKSKAAKLETRLFTLRALIGKNTYVGARSKVAKEIKKVIEERIDANLSGKAKPPFKPLSPSYRKWKLKHYGKLPILVLTGRSKRECKVMTTNEGGSGDRSVLKLKIKVPSYFWYHHTGTKVLPKRDWLSLQEKDKKNIKKILEGAGRVLKSEKASKK